MIFRFAETDIHYEAVGEGRPVLLLHGCPGDIGMMKACMEPVFEAVPGYRRLYVDLPGMGASRASTALASADKLLELLTAMLDVLVGEKALVVGESYGGYLARGLVEKRGAQIDGLMLLCPVVLPEREQRDIPRVERNAWDTKFLAGLSERERSGFCFYGVLGDRTTYERYRREIVPALEAADEAFIERLQANYAFSFALEGRFDKPVLLLAGRQDRCVGYRDQLLATEAYPASTVAVLDLAGHNLQIERPNLFEVLVRDWLLRVGGLPPER